MANYRWGCLGFHPETMCPSDNMSGVEYQPGHVHRTQLHPSATTAALHLTHFHIPILCVIELSSSVKKGNTSEK